MVVLPDIFICVIGRLSVYGNIQKEKKPLYRMYDCYFMASFNCFYFFRHFPAAQLSLGLHKMSGFIIFLQLMIMQRYSLLELYLQNIIFLLLGILFLII